MKMKVQTYFLSLGLLLLQLSLGQAQVVEERLAHRYVRNLADDMAVDPGEHTRVTGSGASVANSEVIITPITQPSEGNNFQASISEDGSRIAFASNSDLIPEENCELMVENYCIGNTEIFLWKGDTGEFVQITHSTGGDGINPANFEPRISADGHSIVFSSNRDLLNGGDRPLNNREIFLWREGFDLPMRITTTTGGGDDANRFPSVNRDGSIIALTSNRNLDGRDAFNTHQIFRRRLQPPTQFIRITNTPGGRFANSEPVINVQGTRIVFTSNQDLTPGRPGNPDGNREIFLWEPGLPWESPGLIRQITNTPPSPVANGNRDNIQPSLNQDGRRIAFSSNRNLKRDMRLEGNPNHDIFLWIDSGGPGRFERITTSRGNGDAIGPNFTANANPSINLRGDSIAFSSNRDLLGDTMENQPRKIFLWVEGYEFILITDSDSMPSGRENNDNDNRLPSISEADGIIKIAFDSNRDLVPLDSDHNKGRSGPFVILHHDANHEIFTGELSSPRVE